MATTRATPIQFLRSVLFNKRPDPTLLLSGQPGVNLNPAEPGLFFADSTGTSLFKVGPCAIGATAPNTGAIAPSALGNCVGELWLDTATSAGHPFPTLKVWNGAAWIQCMPYSYANTVVSPTAPSLTTHPDGTLWWNSATGLMYVLYNDGTTTQWTQVSSSTVG
jgi:hypothetical protein